VKSILREKFCFEDQATFKAIDLQGVRAMPAYFASSFFCSSIFRQENTVNCGLYVGPEEQADRKHAKSMTLFLPLNWSGYWL